MDSFVIYKCLVCIKFLQIIVIFPESPQTITWGESQNLGGGRVTLNVEVIGNRTERINPFYDSNESMSLSQ